MKMYRRTMVCLLRVETAVLLQNVCTSCRRPSTRSKRVQDGAEPVQSELSGEEGRSCYSFDQSYLDSWFDSASMEMEVHHRSMFHSSMFSIDSKRFGKMVLIYGDPLAELE